MSRAAWNSGAIDETAMSAIAARMALAAREGGIVYLEGDLGAGKTSFARALLKTLGAGERIKSPTYSLIESYRIERADAHHLDLYRIADAGELEWLGLSDLWTPEALVLIEWPERGRGALPAPDLVLQIGHTGDRRTIEASAKTPHGERLLAALSGRESSS